MEPLSLQQIAQSCGGDLLAGSPAMGVRRVCIDSRQAQRGDLFLAIAGERFDGHEYCNAALERGAVAVLGERGKLPSLPAGCAVVAVESSRRALGAVAADYRKRFHFPVIAVAGSNGKTTTKDLIASVLSQQFATLASEASYNNDIGVPLSLLRLEAGHQAAVIEVGTNHPGELPALLRLIQPTMGVLTSLAREHLEFFGSLDGVIQEEGWLGELLPTGGKLFLNADCPGVERVLARTRATAIRLGWSDGCDWRALFANSDGKEIRFDVRSPFPLVSGTYRLPAVGRHQVVNAMLALAVGAELGLRSDQLQNGLSAFRPPRMRLQLRYLQGIGLLDDSYNANPDSMRAALDALRALPCAGRRLAVLGDMAELGGHGPSAHAEVGQHAAGTVQQLFAVGPMAPVLAQAAREAGLGEVGEFTDPGAAAAAVATAARPGDLVLVKASRAARLERVVKHLQQRWGSPGN